MCFVFWLTAIAAWQCFCFFPVSNLFYFSFLIYFFHYCLLLFIIVFFLFFVPLFYFFYFFIFLCHHYCFFAFYVFSFVLFFHIIFFLFAHFSLFLTLILHSIIFPHLFLTLSFSSFLWYNFWILYSIVSFLWFLLLFCITFDLYLIILHNVSKSFCTTKYFSYGYLPREWEEFQENSNKKADKNRAIHLISVLLTNTFKQFLKKMPLVHDDNFQKNIWHSPDEMIIMM